MIMVNVKDILKAAHYLSKMTNSGFDSGLQAAQPIIERGDGKNKIKKSSFGRIVFLQIDLIVL